VTLPSCTRTLLVFDLVRPRRLGCIRRCPLTRPARVASPQIALLRDYLDSEFKPASSAPVKGTKATKDAALLPFGYDLERILDDFVFLAMLVRSVSP
jgi:hypothetical protein